jgi:hypothetical protein
MAREANAAPTVSAMMSPHKRLLVVWAMTVLAVVAIVSPLYGQIPATACGESEPLSLPDWFTTGFQASRLGKTHEVACYLNPFYLRGNFDGRGPLDLAVLVVEKATGKRGIVVVHRPSMSSHLLGAGTPIGNGGDDFYWLGYWRVETAPRHHASPDTIPRFVGEVINLVKPESASGWVGWNGRKYVWLQGDD